MLKRINVDARFVYKSKTFAEWQNENPVLLKGEIGFVTDRYDGGFVKIGDGVTPWNSLQFKKNISKEEIEERYATKQQLEETNAVVQTKADYDFIIRGFGDVDTKATNALIDANYAKGIANKAFNDISNLDLSVYAKNTDYASSGRAGVVSVNSSFGIKTKSENGAMQIVAATDNEITQKSGTYTPLVPDKIDLIVKTGITTNGLLLTENEKLAVQNWLGVTDLITSLQNKIAELEDRLSQVS